MCELIRILYALVRLKRFRAHLVRTHFESCPRCGLAGRDADVWAGLVRPPDWISREASLWPEVERRMRQPVRSEFSTRTAPSVLPMARLAVAAGGILAAVVLAVLLWTPVRRGPFSAADAAVQAPRVEVLSAEVEGRPARTSVYQTKGASFIWFYPAPRKEG